MLNSEIFRPFCGLNDVREVLPGLGEPPIAKEEAEKTKNREIGQPFPVGRRPLQDDAPITSNEPGKWIQINGGAILVRYKRFRIDDRCQVQPRR